MEDFTLPTLIPTRTSRTEFWWGRGDTVPRAQGMHTVHARWSQGAPDPESGLHAGPASRKYWEGCAELSY